MVLVAFFPFLCIAVLACLSHLSMVSLLYLASFLALSYWKHAFSQMSLVVSVVAVSIFVASVVVFS